MRVDLPDVFFTIGVDYPDETGIASWRITISMGNVPLLVRRYKNNYEEMRVWRESHEGELPAWYASDVEDAKAQAINQFGRALQRALSAGSANQPIA